MVEILPIAIPEDLQAEALANFWKYNSGELEPKEMPAFEHFTEQVKQESGYSSIYPRIRILVADGTYNDPNTSLHQDFAYPAVKYITTVANIESAATVFIDVEDDEEDFSVIQYPKLGSWVVRSEDALLIRADTPHITKPWFHTQARNGQTARFAMSTDWHAAAMLPKGAHKVLMSVIVPN